MKRTEKPVNINEEPIDKPLILGNLEPINQFHIPGDPAKYQVITPRKWNTSPSIGDMWVYNFDSHQAVWKRCRMRVEVVKG